jgi:hypothetical protein
VARQHTREHLPHSDCARKYTCERKARIADCIFVEGSHPAKPTIPPATQIPTGASWGSANADGVRCGLTWLSGYFGSETTGCLEQGLSQWQGCDKRGIILRDKDNPSKAFAGCRDCGECRSLTGRGAELVSNGEVVYDSLARIKIPVYERSMGYVFQDSRLFPHMTVRGNLKYGYNPAGQIRMEEVVSLLDIGHLLPPKTSPPLGRRKAEGRNRQGTPYQSGPSPDGRTPFGA